MKKYYKNQLSNENPKEGDLRVWHIPQIPGKPFLISVISPEEGKRIIDLLSFYDLFQLDERIKPDFSNANGLEVYDGNDWVTWYSDDFEDIDYYELKDGKLIEPD